MSRRFVVVVGNRNKHQLQARCAVARAKNEVPPVNNPRMTEGELGAVVAKIAVLTDP